MQAWEERILERQEAREEGIQEGIQEGLAKGLNEGLVKGRDQLLIELIRKKYEKGCSPVQISDMLETDLSIVEQFIIQITNNP